MINIGILKEDGANETRVAATPDTVSRMKKAEMAVYIESEAGIKSYFTNALYEQAGAHVVTKEEVLREINVLLKVQKPSLDEVSHYKENTILLAPLYPKRNPELISALQAKQITAFSLDLIPRIARSQSMDILSSMSNIAGYKSVIMAADYLGKLFPMMTTAAGTIQPAKVIVIGAGVAGLQAIATARRLGGVVLAFDTRPVVAEQVKSLGADFVNMEVTHEQSQDAGGYAKEQTAEFYKAEQDIIQKYISDADVVITTALIPGKRAPILITDAMVQRMKPGSVIVDLAAEAEGNCVLSEPGKIVQKHNVTIIAKLNLPGDLSVDASQLYSRNLFNLLNYLAPQITSGQFDMSDEIVKGCMIK